MKYSWKDSSTETQIKYWDSEIIQVAYKILNRSKTKLEYYENGSLKIEAEVFQYEGDSEVEYFNEFGDVTKVESFKGWFDSYNGKYNQYYNSEGKEPQIKYAGSFELFTQQDSIGKVIYLSRPVGEWKFYNIDGTLQGKFKFDWY